MNHRMRRIVETLACERRYGIADAKGAEYSGAGSTYKETDADTLRNFKAVAARSGLTPVQCLLVYFLKHIDSITTTCREAEVQAEGDWRTDRYAEGEGIVSRLDDARNYLDLLECLLIDTGGIEPVRDAEGEAYAQIGEAAAELTFPEKQPGQYPGARFSHLPGRFPNPHNPNGLDLTDPVAVANEIADDSRWAPPEDDGPDVTGCDGCDDPDCGFVACREARQDEDLKRAGLVQGLDGVWRGATIIDESVKSPGERQTPIYARTMDEVRDASEVAGKYGETGELDA